MAKLTAVDYDPFAGAPNTASVQGGGGPATPVNYDPFSAAGAAATAPDTTDANAKVNAFTGGALDLPIIGPAIKGGAQRAAAGIRSVMYGTPYQDELQAVQNYAQNAEQQNPGTNLAGQVAGNVAAFGGLGATGLGAKALGTAADMTVPSLGILGRQIPQMLLRGAGSNAAISAADAAIRGGDPVAAGAIGGLLGAGGNAAGRVIGNAADAIATRGARRAADAMVPTIEQRHTLGTNAYESAKSLGVKFEPTDFSKALGDVKTSILDKFGPESAKGTAGALGAAESKWAPNAAAAPDAMSKLTGVQPKPPAQKTPATVQDFLDVRERLGRIAKGENATERYAAQLAQDQLDAAMPKLAVTSGDPEKAAQLLQEGADHWAAMRRGEIIAGRAELGDLNAATRDNTGSTGGPVKIAAKSLIRPNMEGQTFAERRGFNAPEIAQINRVARGAPLENFYQGLGSMMGGAALQGGTGAAIGAAEALRENKNPLTYGGIGFGIGLGAKKLSSRMTHQQMDVLSKMVLGRGMGIPQQVVSPIKPITGNMGLLLRGATNPLLRP